MLTAVLILFDLEHGTLNKLKANRIGRKNYGGRPSPHSFILFILISFTTSSSLSRIYCSLPPLSLLSANLCPHRSRSCTTASSHDVGPRRRRVAHHCAQPRRREEAVTLNLDLHRRLPQAWRSGHVQGLVLPNWSGSGLIQHGAGSRPRRHGLLQSGVGSGPRRRKLLQGGTDASSRPRRRGLLKGGTAPPRQR
jgi:hypothetical protein